MLPAGILLAGLAVFGTWTGLHKTVSGVKHLDHKIAVRLHLHQKPVAPKPAKP